MKAWLKYFANNLKDDLSRLHTSMTIWFNGVMLSVIEALPMLESEFPKVQEYISPEFYKQAMTVLVIGNIFLRFKTSKRLRDK